MVYHHKITVKLTPQKSSDDSKEVRLGINKEKTKYIFISCRYNSGQNNNTRDRKRTILNAKFAVSGIDGECLNQLTPAHQCHIYARQ
jgi:uncharacterized membrane protein YfhO